MSRMTIERAVERAPQSRLDEATILAMSDSLQGLAQGMKRMQEEADTRYKASEAHVNGAVGAMDATATGLHQDLANVIVRLQTLTTWLGHKFPGFEAESQTILQGIIADAAAVAAAVAEAAEEETESPETEPTKEAVE